MRPALDVESTLIHWAKYFEVELENLIEHLVRELSVTSTQAEGGAGLLLRLVQHKLNAADFRQVADAIPAISDIIGKAPRYEAKITSPAWAVVSRTFGGLGGLTFLVGGFALLGLDKTILPRFVAAVLAYFRKVSGVEVECLLQSVLR